MMGFYDEEQYYSNQQKRSKKSWLAHFSSAVIGGLVVVLLMPTLANYGLLPYEVVGKNTSGVQETYAEQGVTEATPVLKQGVQVNVSSEVIDAVERVSDAIVGVVNIQQTTVDFFARQPRQDVERGTGSGVIFQKVGDKAHIVTNYHVIEGAQKVEISLANGERVEASLKGYDELTDLAVLEIDAEHVDTVAEFGDSDALRTGEPAIAIGNPLGLDFSRTVTQGIISAKDRSVSVSTSMGEWELNVLQTDAAINPGNSGGALINIKGQVIGINSLKIAQRGSGFGSSIPVEGMGFAIPINDARPVIEDLLKYGQVQRPYLGVQITNLTDIDSYHWKNTLHLPDDVKQGIVITNVQAGSPAAEAGLEELDVIVEIDGQEVPNANKLRRHIFVEKSLGDTAELKVFRKGLPVRVKVELTKALGN